MAGAVIGALRVDLGLDSAKFERGVKRAKGSTASLSKSLGGIKIAVASAVAAIASMGVAIRVIGDFDSAMSKVGAVSRATTTDLAAMRDVAKSLGSTTEFSATQAAEGLGFLAMAGFDAKEAIAAIPEVLNLATAAGLGLGQAADVASNIMSGFGVAATDAGDVSDLLAAASSRANTDVAQLGDAMKYVGPVASALGVSMADAAAGIGVLSDAGIQGQMAGTTLRQILSSLINPTDDAAAAIKAMGLTLKEVDPATNRMVDVIGRLAGAGLTAADALTIFGDRGGPGILALTSQVGGLRELTDELQNVEGEATRMATTMRDNLGGDLKGAQSAAEGLILALGDAGLTAVLRTVVQGVTEVLRGFTAITNGISGLISSVANVTADFLGLSNTAIAVQRAVDNVTYAFDDQGRTLANLKQLIADENRLQLESAAIHIQAGKARIKEIEAIVEKNRLLAAEKLGMTDLAVEIQRVRAEIEELESVQLRAAEAGKNLPGITGDPAARAAEIENLDRLLVQLLTKQQEYKEILDTTSYLSPEQLAELDAIDAALVEIRNRQSDVVDEGYRALVPSDRLVVVLGNVSGALSGTVAGANALQRALTAAANAGINLFNSVSRVMAALGSIGSGLSKLGGVGAALGTTFKGLGAAFNGVVNSDGIKGASKLLSDMGQTLSIMHGSAVRAAASIKDVGDKGSSGGAKAARGIDKAGRALKDAEREAKRLADAINRPLASAVDRTVEFMVSGFKGGMGTIKDIFFDTIKQMLTFAIANPIKIALGLGGVGGGAAVAGQAVAAPGGGLLGNLSGGGGLLGELGGIGSALAGGFANSIGSLFSTGIGGMFGSIGAQVGTAIATGTGTAIAGAIGAVAAPLLAVAAVFSFLKKKVTELDSGLRVTVDGMDALVETFRTIETRRFWGLSKKVTTAYTEAEDAVAAPLIQIVNDLQSNIQLASDALGVSADVFDDFTHQIKVSTKGLSEADAQQAVVDALAGLGDAYAEMIPGLIELARVGETSSEALSRLSSSLVAANYAMDLLGLQLYDISLGGADAASSFVDLFGTLQDFSTATGAYYQDFYTAQERAAKATELLTASLSDLGIDALPASRAAFRALIDEADSLGDAELVASLIQLAPAFAEITSAADALNDSLTQNSLFRTQQDAIYAQTAGGYRASLDDIRSGAGESLPDLLREVVTAIREGDVNNARLTNQLYQQARRENLEPTT
ncbi:MAG: phage tail tape measure protein [Paracoccaceae bacterium]